MPAPGYSDLIAGLGNPGVGGGTVAKSDSGVPYGAGVAARSLYVGGTGDVTLVSVSGDVMLFSAVPVGTILPVRHTRVNSTGTTATLMTYIL